MEVYRHSTVQYSTVPRHTSSHFPPPFHLFHASAHSYSLSSTGTSVGEWFKTIQHIWSGLVTCLISVPACNAGCAVFIYLLEGEGGSISSVWLATCAVQQIGIYLSDAFSNFKIHPYISSTFHPNQAQWLALLSWKYRFGVSSRRIDHIGLGMCRLILVSNYSEY